MARAANTNYTVSGEDFEIADAAGDAIERGDLQKLARAVDLHTHAATRGAGVRRLHTTSAPTTTGEVQVTGDDLKWWGASAGAVKTAADTNSAQTLTNKTLTAPTIAAVQGVPAARAYHTANQTIANGTPTALAFNSERFDTDTIHDAAVNTSRLTCKTAGRYLISGHVQYAANATGTRAANVRLNGATFIATHTVPAAIGGEVTQLSTSTVYDLAVNDYVELIANQSSGGNLDVSAAGNYSPEFTMVRVA